MRILSYSTVACMAVAGSVLASANADAQRAAPAPLRLETLYADSAGHIYFRGRRLSRAMFDSAAPGVRAQREMIFFSWAGSPALRTAGEDSVFAHLTRDHVNFELRADSTLHAKLLPDRFGLVPSPRTIVRGDTMFAIRRWESGGADTAPRFVAHEHSGEFFWPARRPMTPATAAELHQQLAWLDESSKALARALADVHRLYIDANGRIYMSGTRTPLGSLEPTLRRQTPNHQTTVWLSWAGEPGARNAAQDSAFKRLLATHAYVEFRTDSTAFSRRVGAPRVISDMNPDMQLEHLERGDTEYVVAWRIHDNHFDTLRVMLYRADSVIRIRPLPPLAMPAEVAAVLRRVRAATRP